MSSADPISAEEAARLLEGATPGPWYAVDDDIVAKTDADLLDDLVAECRAAEGDPALIAAAPALAESVVTLSAEVERLRAVVAPELTFRDVEMKVRDGSIDIKTVLGDDSQPAMRFLAAIMLHVLLGEGDGEPVEPPNYQSCEFTLTPAGSYEQMRACIEIIKPGGRSSHDIRRDLEARVAELEAAAALRGDTEGGES